jgi:hypothetical protein
MISFFEITSDEHELLEGILDLFLTNWTSFVGYERTEGGEKPTLKLKRNADLSTIPFVVPVFDAAMLASTIRDWLRCIDWKKVPGKCGGDGSDVKGFSIKCNSYLGQVIIYPTWVYYGK